MRVVDCLIKKLKNFFYCIKPNNPRVIQYELDDLTFSTYFKEMNKEFNKMTKVISSSLTPEDFEIIKRIQYIHSSKLTIALLKKLHIFLAESFCEVNLVTLQEIVLRLYQFIYENYVGFFEFFNCMIEICTVISYTGMIFIDFNENYNHFIISGLYLFNNLKSVTNSLKNKCSDDSILQNRYQELNDSIKKTVSCLIHKCNNPTIKMHFTKILENGFDNEVDAKFKSIFKNECHIKYDFISINNRLLDIG